MSDEDNNNFKPAEETESEPVEAQTLLPTDQELDAAHEMEGADDPEFEDEDDDEEEESGEETMTGFDASESKVVQQDMEELEQQQQQQQQEQPAPQPQQPQVHVMTTTEKAAMEHAQRMRTYRQAATPDVSLATLQQFWFNFFNDFTLSKKATSHPKPEAFYKTAIREMPSLGRQTLTIDYNHVRQYVEQKEAAKPEDRTARTLLNSILTRFPDSRTAAQMALLDMMKMVVPDYVEVVRKGVTFGVKNIPITIEIPDINHEYIGKPIHITGMCVSVDKPLLYMSKIIYRCSDGHPNVVYSKGTEHQPLKACTYEKCKSTSLNIDEAASTRDSFQLIRLQQRMDMVKPGTIPETIECVIFGKDRMNVINGGDYADVSGIVMSRSVEKKSFNSLAEFYIEVTSIDSKSDEFLFDNPIIAAAVEDAVHANTEEEDIKMLYRSIAPSIHGHEALKELCLMFLAGSDSLYSDGSRHRGEGQLFIVGDPATAKTKIGKATARLFGRGVIGSGRGATEKGLTVGVDHDKRTGAKRMDIGTYPMASSKTMGIGGCVFLDEMDKADKEIIKILSTLMDDEQTLDRNATSTHINMQINCASIHCANPINKENDGKYDRSKTIIENTGLPKWLLTRYDAVVVVVDEPDAATDEAKARHWLAAHVNSKPDNAVDDDSPTFTAHEDLQIRIRDETYWRSIYMRYWAKHVRTKYHPKLKEKTEAAELLIRFYLKMRGGANLSGSRTSMRDMPTLVRMAEMSARMCHRNEVFPRDAKRAIRVFEFAMASSGFNPITGQMKTIEVQSDKEIAAKQQSGKNTLLQSIVQAIESVTNRKCQACNGLGRRVVSTDPTFGNIEEPCMFCVGGHVQSSTFYANEVVTLLKGKVPAEEIRNTLHNLNDAKVPVLLYSNGPQGEMYSKVPQMWTQFKHRFLPMDQLG